MLFIVCSSTVAMAGDRQDSSDITMSQGHFLSKNFNAERSSLTRKGLDSVSPTPAIASSTASPFASKPPSFLPAPHTSAPESWAVESDPLLGFTNTQTSASAQQQRQNATQMQTKTSFAAVPATQSQPTPLGVQPSASMLATTSLRQAHAAPMAPAMRPKSASGGDGILRPTPMTHSISHVPSIDLHPHASATLFSGMSVAPSSSSPSTGTPPSSLPQSQVTPTPPQWHQHTTALTPSATPHHPPAVAAPALAPQTPSLFTNMSMGYSVQQPQQGASAATLQPALMPTRVAPLQGTFGNASQPQMPSFAQQDYHSSAAPHTVNAPGVGGPLWGSNQGTTQMFTAPLTTVTPLSKQDLEDLLS